MNGEHAYQTIDDRRDAGFHADVRGLCEALGGDAAPPSSRRSEAATQPYADPFADTVAAGGSSFASDCPEWCVDVGSALLTMTTFELWEALERGRVAPGMRVWREGMECWTPVGEVSELTWAIAGTPAPPAEPEAFPPAPLAPSEVAPLELAPPELASPETDEVPPESAIRPLPVSPRFRGARWIALGSAVAIAAIVSAIVVGGGSPPAPPAETRGASAPPVAEHAATVPSPLVKDPPAPLAATRHDERGQRRLPRDGRRR
jgi:hypothetical protein